MRAVAATQAHLGPEEIRYLADSTNRRAMRELVTHFLGESLSRGVADAGVIRGEASRQITLRRNDAERVVARDSILTFADLMEQAEAAGIVIEDPVGQRTLRRLVGTFYHPTIVPDPMLTSARRERLRASVDPVRFGVRAGERIVVAGQAVTEDQRAKLIGLHQELERRGAGGSGRGRGGRTALQHAGPGRVLAAHGVLPSETYAEVREMAFFGALFSLVVLITAGTTSCCRSGRRWFPIPFAAILVTLLYNGRIGVFARSPWRCCWTGSGRSGTAASCSSGWWAAWPGAIGIRAVRRRRHLYVTVAVVAAASMLASHHDRAAPGLVDDHDRGQRPPRLADGARQRRAGDAGDAAGRVGDPHHHRSHPAGALRPGPAAAPPPGAGGAGHLGPQPGHGQPVRVRLQHHRGERTAGAGGVLLSRIGKLTAPGFFVENQGGGPNPHDQMRPPDSARIIRQHVLDGIDSPRTRACRPS